MTSSNLDQKIKKAQKLIPAWFVVRMMSDRWSFGILTSDGRTFVINQILEVSEDGKWIDVELALKKECAIEQHMGQNFVYAIAEDRRIATINVLHVVCAMELATS